METVGVRGYLRDVGGNDGRFRESVKYVDQPSRKVFATIFSQVEASHTPQSDAQGLKEDSEEVRHEDDEEMRKSGSGTSYGLKLAIIFFMCSASWPGKSISPNMVMAAYHSHLWHNCQGLYMPRRSESPVR